MNNYLVFAGADYYPSGGWEDYRGEYAGLEQARNTARTSNEDWYQIVHDNKVIESGRVRDLK